MSDWDHNSYKIIFTGPVGAGKTTAINALSDIKAVSTEKTATDETRFIKKSTTVAMDYGKLKMQDGSVLHLYGTPGQSRFDFMWDVLTRGSLGLIIIIDGSSPTALDDLEYYLNAFQLCIAQTTLAIGVNNSRSSTDISLDSYYNFLETKDIKCPIFSIDARKKKDVYILLLALLQNI